MRVAYDIVGCGEELLKNHLQAISFLRQSGLSVRACIDPSAENAQQAAKLLGARTFGVNPGFEDLSEPPDAVLITTPLETRANMAATYLSRGVHALISSPFAGSAADADEVFEAMRSGGAHALVAHTGRLYPAVRIAQTVVRNGLLGEILRATVSHGNRFDEATTSRYLLDSHYGGVLYDRGAHVLDTLLYILGLDGPDLPEFEVRSTVRTSLREWSQDVRASIEVKSEAYGVTPIGISLSRVEALPQAVTIYGSLATLVVPAYYASSPTTFVKGDPLRIQSKVSGPRPGDEMACFALAHRALCLLATETSGTPRGEHDAAKHTQSDLDPHRFELLAQLLERISDDG
jgi:predicted dehydrogenase